MKLTPVFVLTLACLEISVKCLSQGRNDVIPSAGIESSTLRSIAQRSNQLSYAAADFGEKFFASRFSKQRRYVLVSSE